MSYTNKDVNWVYDKTGGYCFYCDMRLSFKNYGKVGEKGAWEIDHFIPVAGNGAHQPYNWVPACVNCNTEKSDFLLGNFVQGDSGKGIGTLITIFNLEGTYRTTETNKRRTTRSIEPSSL